MLYPLVNQGVGELLPRRRCTQNVWVQGRYEFSRKLNKVGASHNVHCICRYSAVKEKVRTYGYVFVYCVVGHSEAVNWCGQGM